MQSHAEFGPSVSSAHGFPIGSFEKLSHNEGRERKRADVLFDFIGPCPAHQKERINDTKDAARSTEEPGGDRKPLKAHAHVTKDPHGKPSRNLPLPLPASWEAAHYSAPGTQSVPSPLPVTWTVASGHAVPPCPR